MQVADSSPATSIFDGTDQIIHDALGLRAGQTLKQLSVCRQFSATRLPDTFKAEIVSTLFGRIKSNWTGRVPSQENWRHERRTAISDDNRSPEVVLERAIATLAELGDLPQWFNQIPVASGLVSDRSDKRAALDLARVDDEMAELVELKWASDTPLFALFEVIRYALALLLSRMNAQKFCYSGRPLIERPVLNLVVLAPHQFYLSLDLCGFEDVIGCGLDQLVQDNPGLPKLSFRFLRFPTSFELPFLSGAGVNAMRTGGSVEGRTRLREAVASIQPVWER